jgi:malate dehydrogenase (oxaloacetate-decarboxylating)
MDYEFATDHAGKPYLKVKLADFALLSHPLLNKGTAFPPEEREIFGLIGLLPPSQTTLAIQRARSFETFQSKTSDIEKYIYLRDLQDSNETLFYSLIQEHITELMPIFIAARAVFLFHTLIAAASNKFFQIHALMKSK